MARLFIWVAKRAMEQITVLEECETRVHLCLVECGGQRAGLLTRRPGQKDRRLLGEIFCRAVRYPIGTLKTSGEPTRRCQESCWKPIAGRMLRYWSRFQVSATLSNIKGDRPPAQYERLIASSNGMETDNAPTSLEPYPHRVAAMPVKSQSALMGLLGIQARKLSISPQIVTTPIMARVARRKWICFKSGRSSAMRRY